MEGLYMNKTIQTRRGRIVALAGGLTLLATGLTVPAMAQTTGQNATTGANVGGTATAPVIECAWALNDVDHTWASAPKMQYGQDDTPSTGAGLPCVASGDEAAMTSNPYLTKVIDVKPNAHDEPTEQWVELWGAITSNNANPNVYFDVYHPNENGPNNGLKVQVDAEKYADSSMPTRCTGPSGMFSAAQATGQMTYAAQTNMQGECMYQQKSFWYGAFPISKHQPNGRYKVVMHAAAANGGESLQTFYINVVGFMNLEKDFTNVDFGPVSANSHYNQLIGGNFNFEGADLPGNQLTSVRNTGNSGVNIGVKFASMCLVSAASCTDDKRIDHFDAKFGVGVLANLEAKGYASLATSLESNLASSLKPAPLGPPHYFSTDLARTLCPNDVGKIEFSIWTENIQSGIYNSGGSAGIQLVAVSNTTNCPTDNGLVYSANLGLPLFQVPATVAVSNTHWA
jgi:hypothetical protein